MVRFAVLVAVGTVGVALAQEPKADPTAVVVLERSGGNFADPKATPPSHYGFTLGKDGAWELKYGQNQMKKGKLEADAVAAWVKAVQDGGFAKLKSNPALGAADEPFLDVTLRVGDKAERKKIRLEEKLAQALDKKVVEVVKGK